MQIIKNYGLSIVLFLLFISSWWGQHYFQWQEFVSQETEHRKEAQIEEYIPVFMKSTLENWQSEFLQLFTFVVLTSFLIHKGSHESKDSSDKMQASLGRIEKILKSKK